MSEILNVITAVFEQLPKRFKSSTVLKALEKTSDFDIQASDKTLYKFLETFAYTSSELLARDPGLFHTMLGLDTEQSRERHGSLKELLRIFLLSDAPSEHIRKNVPELPAHQIVAALLNLSLRLNRYRGDASDAPAFTQWALARSTVEARLLVFHAQLLTDFKPCIYAGILSRLKNATDLCPLDYADDLYSEVLKLMLEGKAEEFLIPGTASIETRLRRLAARHTQIYLKSLIDKRKSVEANRHRIDCGRVVSDAELKVIKRQENHERRLRYNSRRSISDME